MPKIAGTYDYQDPRDPSDTFDRFEQADYEPRDKDGGSAERGRPFTDGGDRRLFRTQVAHHDLPDAGAAGAEAARTEKGAGSVGADFDPLAGLDEAMSICRRAPRSHQTNKAEDSARRSRIRNTIKGILSGQDIC